MASDDSTQELVELRPAPAVLLRHRDADLDVVTAPRTGPRVELRRGALWIRAGEEGPGVTVTHGASSVQVRAGAGVVEVLDMEALLVVAAGRAAVKGVSPLPRSVIAGQAVTLTLDGTFTDPDALSAAELAADRMVVENLALDNLAASPASAPAPAVAPAEPPADLDVPPPLPTRVPGATTEARVDPPGAPQVERTGDPFAPRVRSEPEPEAVTPTAAAPVPTAEPAPAAPVPPPAPLPVAEPAAAVVEPAPPPSPPVGRPAPSLPPAGPSALEMALHGVGVTDTPLEPGATRTPVAAPLPANPLEEPVVKPPRRQKREPRKPKPAKLRAEPTEEPTAAGAPTATTATASPDDDRRRTRILVALVIAAFLVLAIVAALAFSGA